MKESTIDTSNFTPIEDIVLNPEDKMNYFTVDKQLNKHFEIINDYSLMSIDLIALIGEGQSGFGKVSNLYLQSNRTKYNIF